MPGETYASAGVDEDALQEVKDRIGAFARITHGPQVVGSPGGFAGVYSLEGYENPLLVSSTDNVGTKLLVGALLGHFESLGMDLVNLNINDVLTKGARPLFFLDYLPTGAVDVQRIDSLLRGMSWACREAGCALIGGETAHMPGVYQPDEFDLAGFVVGAVERDSLIDGSTIQEGDAILGVPSSGVHTNGFSLVRRVFGIDSDPEVLYGHHDDLDHTLGEELLIPHKCYYPMLEPALPFIKGMAHITGGGFEENVPRVLPSGLSARVKARSWDVPRIFDLIQRTGNVDTNEMYRVFNMGIGMVMVCAPVDAAEIQQLVPEAIIVGEVEKQVGKERVILEDKG